MADASSAVATHPYGRDAAASDRAGLQRCRAALKSVGVIDGALVDEASQYERHPFCADRGSGWLDLYQVNHGILVGRSEYDLHPDSCMHAHVEGLPGYFALACVYSGAVFWRRKGARGREYIPNQAAIFCPPQARRQEVTYEWHRDRPFSGICVSVPHALVQELHDDCARSRTIRPGFGSDDAASLLSAGHAGLRQAMQAMQMLMRIAPVTTAGRLQMESLALGVAAVLCQSAEDSAPRSARRHLPYRQRLSVDEACHILQTEFAVAHTIASLARRVHLNECYLKSAFRQTTGETIAEYLRRIRMERARELIESQRASVLQASLFVGYANQSMFAAAFKAHYGFVPSRLK